MVIEKEAIAFSDHVIIYNHIWEKTLISRSVKKEKCTTILNYPDQCTFQNQIKKPTDDNFSIIYPGTLNWHQGLDIAIKAFALITDKVPHAKFYIYGEGSEKEYLSRLITQFGLEDRIYLKGLIPLEEIANVMARSDLGIVPKRANSFGDEAFSTKILEFMALGVPVLISDATINEYYFDDSLVKFFKSENEKDLAKSILMLIKDQKLRNCLVKNSIKFIEKNNWQTKKSIYLEIVNSLTNNRNAKKWIYQFAS